MDRDKQLESVEGLLTWYDEIMNNYEAAFWIHYRMLCRTVEIWVEEVENNNTLARVTYFVNTEYMSMVLCELLLTVETLFKAELTRAGNTKTMKTHKLIDLMANMKEQNDDRCSAIFERFKGCLDFFFKTDIDNAFSNVRYIDHNSVVLDSNVSSKIKKTLVVLDDVYNEFYSEFDIGHLLYLGMAVDDYDENLSEDDNRRLENLGLK